VIWLNKNFNMTRQRAVFLDRDGVLNFDSGYLANTNKLKILPKVIEGLQKIKKLGFKSIIISNQSGVARKYFDLKTMWAIDTKLKKLINKKEILLDDSFYCPHHPDFDKNCNCRKPKIGLIKKALKRYRLDTSKSFFIGDNMEDVLCGKNAGCKTILVPKNLNKHVQAKPNFIAKDLIEAACWIENNQI